MKLKTILCLMVVLLCFAKTGLAKGKPKVAQLTRFDSKRLRFGFYFGTNTMDAGMRFYPSVSDNPQFQSLPAEMRTQISQVIDTTANVYADAGKLSMGFSVGIVTNLRINDYLDLRVLPGMSFGSRHLYYSEPIYSDVQNPTENNIISSIEVKSSYIDVPILLKYKARRLVNNRPYIIGGPSFHFDLEKKGREENIFSMSKSSMNFDIGVGLDSYMQFFRLSTEIKYSIGLNNIIKYDLGGEGGQIPPVYSYPVETFHAHMFTLLFYFE